MSTTFAERLKTVMNINGLSAADVVTLTGLTKGAISCYLNGKYEPKQNTIFVIAKALRVSEAFLLGLSNDIHADAAAWGLPVTRRTIPLLGNVHCGSPTYAQEEYEDQVESDIRADFALRAKGDSMTGIGIFDGDLLFVRKQETVRDGELVVVLIDDEAAVKRFQRIDDGVLLLAENPSVPALIVKETDGKDLRVLGKVIAFTHYLK